MNCKIILNTDSGNCSRLDLAALLNNIDCENPQIETINSHSDFDTDGFDTVIVCGGDGTLSSALGKCVGKKLMYVPCGTMNEASKNSDEITRVGKANENLFSYVCACGSFTEIGYKAKPCDKKRYKTLAYAKEILRAYRSKEISATLTLDGKKISGEFTLLMVLKKDRCFGMKFNRCYNKHNGLYLVAIKSCGKDTLLNRIKMFFPFCRVFWMGVNNPKQTDKWLVLPFNSLTMELKEKQDFCIDGEKRSFDGTIHFSEQKIEPPITVIKTPYLKRKNKY